MVDRHDDPQGWISAYFVAATGQSGSPVRLGWTDKHTGLVKWNGTVLAEARLVPGDTDSTEGPGFPMRLTLEVQESAFTYAIAFDDDLAALDWALLGLGEEGEVDSDIFLASLRKGWEKRTDHSRLWRGDGVFPMLQNHAESLASLPESRLTFWTDPPYEVRLSYQDNFVRMSTAEHDTVNVEFKGLSVLLECPVWVHGLNSWVDDFYRRLRTEDLWLVRTKFLGIPVRKDFLFDEDVPAMHTWGLATKSSELFLPAVNKERSSP
ncbi:hypothetical protein ARGLB_029_00010 [Arthrobacter globiformis NBRC 12137]|uniref:Uncharacterized protein n=1 Tax=Arthrobacter globiformis (strain ATCC 8010 / DSM 20124 / JCM 1332 / NBRC 12137 / NCIMB 8907 / NRRL B-2979 / 168) TaxID=1077972 RepID=H0QJC4_ARTG1|nr:hypothetical protein ARGLB_029_00010 [Arthrobacter globiformis NBRC 12137]